MNEILTEQDKEYMRRAISLAKLGLGWTNPNPMVGAVIVKNNKIIGEGYHRKCGELHAERDAFTRLTEDAKGATMYVTLEPCCHYGKQPPCTEAVVEHGIKRVVIGSRDPNPLVAGKGVSYLREHGIEVIEDFLREECDEINPVFFHYITTGKPYVVMKYAMTLDGKIATRTGRSKWITGEKARLNVQHERGSYAAIMVGIGTVLADNPMLNVRLNDSEAVTGINAGMYNGKYHQPVRVILDSHLRIPLDCNIVSTANEYRTIVAYVDGDEEKIMLLEKAGIELIKCQSAAKNIPEDNEVIDSTSVDIPKVLDYLGENKIDSVYVEGGGRIHESLMKSGHVSKVSAYIAPKIFGGSEAKSPVEGLGVSEVSDALLLNLKNVTNLGDDVWLEYERK